MVKPYYDESGITIYCGDCREVLPQLSDVNCCVSSPPYWALRDYGTGTWSGGLPDCDHTYIHGVQGKSGQRADRTFTARAVYKGQCGKCGALRIDSQIGLEVSHAEYVETMRHVFAATSAVMADNATLWLNMGDSYAASRSYQVADNKNPSVGPTRNLQRATPPDGLKQKDLIGIPWRVAFALQADGWYLRSDIIWHKPNPMPESVTDRPTKAHEYLFLLAKSEHYYYNAEAIKEPASPDTHARYQRGRSDNHKWADGRPGGQTIATNKPGSLFAKKVPAGWHQGTRGAEAAPRDRRADGVHPKAAEPGSGIKANTSFSAAVKDVVESRNKRSVWTIPTQPYPEAHFATFPEDLIKPCILAGCPPGGLVLDPFGGSGTTMQVARFLGRRGVMIELNEKYCELAVKRLRQGVLSLTEEATA